VCVCVCVCSGCRERSVDGRSRVRRGVSTSPSLSARWSCSCTAARHVSQLAACTRPSHPTRPGDASLVLVARLRTPGQQVVTCTCQWRRQNLVTGGEVRYGSIGGVEYEVHQSRLYCLCINVALCSTPRPSPWRRHWYLYSAET